jgi:predicted alpha/beta hydrolase
MPASQPGWSPRRPTTPPPAAASEVIALSTASGVTLAVEVREAPRARATAILLHSSMASRRIWSVPGDAGFAAVFADCGVRTLALDFRGHGESGTSASRGGRWNFDDLAREDLPALCRAARERWPGDRLTLVGHSLGGQVALAAAAADLVDADAIAVISTNVWLPSEEPNPFLRARKGAIVRMMRVVTTTTGYFPARALGIGSDDESAPYVEGWTSNWERDRWLSDDLAVDYMDAMGCLRLPILAVTSLADRFLCTPQAAFSLHPPRIADERAVRIGPSSRRWRCSARSHGVGRRDARRHGAHDAANFCLG